MPSISKMATRVAQRWLDATALTDTTAHHPLMLRDFSGWGWGSSSSRSASRQSNRRSMASLGMSNTDTVEDFIDRTPL